MYENVDNAKRRGIEIESKYAINNLTFSLGYDHTKIYDKATKKILTVYADKLKYYCYVHHFKRYADKLPYYFGNLDVFIDNEAFLKIENTFMTLEDNEGISEYFVKLFGKFIK